VNKTVVLIVVFSIVVLAAIIYSSMGLREYRVEVCMEYQGRSACRIATASNERDAVQTAVVNACAQISSGMTDSMRCQNQPPRSVKTLD
jgi:hypothetical protein